MEWNIEISAKAEAALDKLEKKTAQRILAFLFERLSFRSNPRELGEPLKGLRLAGLWRYRVGDCRVLCQIRDETISVLVVAVDHRREVYK